MKGLTEIQQGSLVVQASPLWSSTEGFAQGLCGKLPGCVTLGWLLSLAGLCFPPEAGMILPHLQGPCEYWRSLTVAPGRMASTQQGCDPLGLLVTLRECRETLDGCRGRPMFKNRPSPEESLWGRAGCLGNLGIFSGSGVYEGREIVGSSL